MDAPHDIMIKTRLARWSVRCCAMIVGGLLAVGGSSAVAQLPYAAAPPAALPEPIHWKQDLFLIPYQWSSSEPGAAQSVRLLVSQDRGTTWQVISEAKPNVKAFNYRAPGDGDYWFAVRTIDSLGRALPAGPYQPELRVIVDKRVPQIDTLAAKLLNDGVLELRWSASDAHLNPDTWRIEVQTDSAGAWTPIAVAHSPGTVAGQTTWRPPTGRAPLAVRAGVSDLAGNSATATVAVAAATNYANTPLAPAASPAPSWTSAAPSAEAIAESIAASAGAPDQLARQEWPASVSQSVPYRLYDSAAGMPADGATRYGNPTGIGTASVPAVNSDGRLAEQSDYAPLEPYRQASLRRLPEVTVGGEAASHAQEVESQARNVETNSVSVAIPPGIEPKRVGSRTFALEYELAEVGRAGVSRIELWGTRNGGQTWRRYAQDDDFRSPIQTTVEGEGLYGFRILAESAAGMPAAPPQPGEAPELWVKVDLHRPFAELTAVEPGSGNQSDHLVLRWRAEDDNLEARPIALFYSSRPTGPWSVIAAGLENTGAYSWRVERHVPDRCYLRLEVRDTAGNRAAYQTLEPVDVGRQSLSVKLRTTEPAESQAASSAGMQR